MGKASRDKGIRGERMARDVLNKLVEAYKGAPLWQRSLLQSRGGGQEASDIVSLDHDGVRAPLHCEVKFGARPNIMGAMRQAREDCAAGAIPFTLTKKDREGWLITCDVDNIFELADQLRGKK